MSTQVLKIESWQQKIFWLLLVAVLVSIIIYMGLINSLIFNLAARESLDQQRLEFKMMLGEQERQYLLAVEKITIEQAYALGFEDATRETVYALATPDRR